ncbi:MAG TPA: hypothetical protein DCE55_24760 [Planctomycetaceae bacterium]|nr:hypothetical protein [Planctomycetaceae bacterium]
MLPFSSHCLRIILVKRSWYNAFTDLIRFDDVKRYGLPLIQASIRLSMQRTTPSLKSPSSSVPSSRLEGAGRELIGGFFPQKRNELTLFDTFRTFLRAPTQALRIQCPAILERASAA